MATTTILLALLSGALIGLVLGLVGGGGSVLAVPLLVYLVGVASPHQAIGTAAIAVALNALASLVGHWRAGTVKWRCAGVFAAAGMSGAALGAELGKAFDGEKLLALFGLLMIGVGVTMLRKRQFAPLPDVHLTRDTAGHLLPRLVPIGLAVGLMAGFFGIGGGFLIVPGLMLATAMPMANAVGTSLVAVTALGLTTALSYAASGYVDFTLAAILIAGGLAGAVGGIALGRRMADIRGALEATLGIGVILVGIYVVTRSLMA